TGGSDGIGAVAGRVFAQEGARVILVARNEEKGEKIATSIRDEGGDAYFIKADISQVNDVRQLMEQTLRHYGELHVLYNNAAIFLPMEDGPITDLKEEVWERVLAINLTGTFLCTKYAIPHIIRAGGGSIISTSSTGGILGLGNTAYGASKAGVINLMKNVAIHYASQKIRANTIIPSITETPMVLELFSDPMVRQQWEAATPIGRFGKPEEVARLALYLASDDSGYVTGTEFLIDGGFCAR
ncbi:MAG: SDR family oxidoreductase, partial [Rubrivivax sp.]|nr:SDR family oxidoreductase [Rubrivivax sp.]